MFSIERLVADCRIALREHSPQAAVKELLARVVSEPAAVEAALGTPTLAQIQTLHHAPDLMVLNVIWAPGMALHPHDHRMWAAIGIYGGQEDNTFYRRTEDGLVEVSGREFKTRDCVLLGPNVIHAVANPRRTFTGAIHVYGGDFFGQARSDWDPETFEERPFDIQRTRSAFALANERQPAAVE
jgi:predicted metal-dependent enzyme (double-stranded beta helix superfamily)